MKKKILSTVLTMLMITSLTACGDNEPTKTTEKTTETNTASKTETQETVSEENIKQETTGEEPWDGTIRIENYEFKIGDTVQTLIDQGYDKDIALSNAFILPSPNKDDYITIEIFNSEDEGDAVYASCMEPEGCYINDCRNNYIALYNQESIKATFGDITRDELETFMGADFKTEEDTSDDFWNDTYTYENFKARFSGWTSNDKICYVTFVSTHENAGFWGDTIVETEDKNDFKTFNLGNHTYTFDDSLKLPYTSGEFIKGTDIVYDVTFQVSFKDKEVYVDMFDTSNNTRDYLAKEYETRTQDGYEYFYTDGYDAEFYFIIENAYYIVKERNVSEKNIVEFIKLLETGIIDDNEEASNVTEESEEVVTEESTTEDVTEEETAENKEVIQFEINGVHALSTGKITMSGELTEGTLNVGDTVILSYSDGSQKECTIKSLDEGKSLNVQTVSAENRVGIEFEEIINKNELENVISISR